MYRDYPDVLEHRLTWNRRAFLSRLSHELHFALVRGEPRAELWDEPGLLMVKYGFRLYALGARTGELAELIAGEVGMPVSMSGMIQAGLPVGDLVLASGVSRQNSTGTPDGAVTRIRRPSANASSRPLPTCC